MLDHTYIAITCTEDLILLSFSKIYDRYAKYLSRYFNELCLSPQSRAKIGALKVNAQEEEQDPLLTALRERNSYE